MDTQHCPTCHRLTVVAALAKEPSAKLRTGTHSAATPAMTICPHCGETRFLAHENERWWCDCQLCSCPYGVTEVPEPSKRTDHVDRIHCAHWYDARMRELMDNDAEELKKLAYESPVNNWVFTTDGSASIAYPIRSDSAGPYLAATPWLLADADGLSGVSDDEQDPWQVDWDVVVATMRRHGYAIEPKAANALAPEQPKSAWLRWCHANTQHNHAFIAIDGDDGPRTSLCGIRGPREIKTYGALRQCPECHRRLELGRAGYVEEST